MQYVVLNGEKSSEVIMNTSVAPQGFVPSVLGPFLCLVYISGIISGIKANIRLFADDCIIYRIFNNSNDIIII